MITALATSFVFAAINYLVKTHLYGAFFILLVGNKRDIGYSYCLPVLAN